MAFLSTPHVHSLLTHTHPSAQLSLSIACVRVCVLLAFLRSALWFWSWCVLWMWNCIISHKFGSFGYSLSTSKPNSFHVKFQHLEWFQCRWPVRFLALIMRTKSCLAILAHSFSRFLDFRLVAKGKLFFCLGTKSIFFREKMRKNSHPKIPKMTRMRTA